MGAMKHLALKIYGLIALAIMLCSTAYVVYDLSLIKTERYAESREQAASLAARISRGAPLGEDQLMSVTSVQIIQGENTDTIFSRSEVNRLNQLVRNGDYTFPIPPAGELRITLELLSNTDLLARIRILLLVATGLLLSTGLLLGLVPRKKRTPKPRALTSQLAAEQGCMDLPSGLMARDQLETRLNSELKRAASFDQDLVLAAISSAQASQWSFVELGHRIRSFFLFKDLCFKYNDTTACVILPNIELDEGIRTMRDFLRKLGEDRGAQELNVGLTARNGRLLDAHTLLHEAAAALEKSAGDSDQAIFGFRADPKKYRSVVAEV